MLLVLFTSCVTTDPDDSGHQKHGNQDSGGTVDSGDPADSGQSDDSGDSGADEPPELAGEVQYEIQYTGTINTDLGVELWDLDLFDTRDSVLTSIEGTFLLCYFSAGSWEDWRDDAGEFPDSAIGKALDGWEGENWLDTRDVTVRSIMESRMDHAVERGCDGVDPDNVDGYTQKSGFDLTYEDQLDYNRFLAQSAHDRGLLVSLKNDLDQLEDLAADFDLAVNESCAEYRECARLSVFTDDEKPVLHIEYVDNWSDAQSLADEVCGIQPGLSTLIKTWDLDEHRLACP